MQRSLWKGAISFGLVHIPVEMFPAVGEKSLDLTMLDRRDFSPIGFKRYNKTTQEEVSWDQIVKGYEYKEGEYVVLTEEDLRRANVEATSTIDILAFVDAAEVPLLYFEHPYYLAPGKGGDKVYALLRETLRHTGKIGIATVVIRVKQHLAALLCVGDTIVLNTLRYPDEIHPADALSIPSPGSKASAISDKELRMATSLVEGMSEPWRPGQYHDTYREDVLALVAHKIKTRQTHTLTPPAREAAPARSSNVVDLVALLQQSLRKAPARTSAGTQPISASKTPAQAAPKTKSSAKPSANTSAKTTPRRKSA